MRSTDREGNASVRPEDVSVCPSICSPTRTAHLPSREAQYRMAGIALVTGANRGIGLEVCRLLGKRGFAVILTARDAAKGQAAAGELRRNGLDARFLPLDITDESSIRAAAAAMGGSADRLDALVNNAAILYDTWQRVLDADLAVVRQAFDTNTLGAWRVSQAFLPWLRRSGHGRIVNVSSGAGSFSSMNGGTPAYAISKVALNALTCMLAAELRPAGILVNAVCPGWVETDMGGAGGRPVSEGAAGVVWAATLPDGGPTGGFFRDGKPIGW
jgi:NAD(P)-dependent dehydrogenase (short-subunit alcohol dehydrogenase family)